MAIHFLGSSVRHLSLKLYIIWGGPFSLKARYTCASGNIYPSILLLLWFLSVSNVPVSLNVTTHFKDLLTIHYMNYSVIQSKDNLGYITVIVLLENYPREKNYFGKYISFGGQFRHMPNCHGTKNLKYDSALCRFLIRFLKFKDETCSVYRTALLC